MSDSERKVDVEFRFVRRDAGDDIELVRAMAHVPRLDETVHWHGADFRVMEVKYMLGHYLIHVRAER